jgi:hypothetical protein
MTDLMEQLRKQGEDLQRAVKMLRKSGDEWAEAERDYQIAKSQAVLTMKDAGCTMTEINLRIKGEVADKLFKRDKARVFYDSNMEYINVAKKQLQTIENQINREWNSNG